MNPTDPKNTADSVQQAAAAISDAAMHVEQSLHAHPTLLQSLGLIGVYSIAGVLVAVLGYKLFDWFTPGDLHKEIIENKNIAAAIIGAAIILGVCILVAASIMG